MRYLAIGFGLSAAILGLAIVGCGDRATEVKPIAAPPAVTQAVAPKEDPEEAEIREALAKLSPEDRAAAEKQRFCVIDGENRLGVMGTPFKVGVKGRTVFICCKSCERRVLADPDKAMAQLDKMMKTDPK